jgi:hypothetical protein
MINSKQSTRPVLTWTLYLLRHRHIVLALILVSTHNPSSVRSWASKCLVWFGHGDRTYVVKASAQMYPDVLWKANCEIFIQVQAVCVQLKVERVKWLVSKKRYHYYSFTVTVLLTLSEWTRNCYDSCDLSEFLRLTDETITLSNQLFLKRSFDNTS